MALVTRGLGGLWFKPGDHHSGARRVAPPPTAQGPPSAVNAAIETTARPTAAKQQHSTEAQNRGHVDAAVAN
jgi:hypothetical protein